MYRVYEKEFFHFYFLNLVFALVWLFLFFVIPKADGTTSKFTGSGWSGTMGQLNWSSWLYLQASFGLGIRNSPYFSMMAPFWVGDHTGYKHHGLDGPMKTGIADTCQRTRSYYGVWSDYIMHGMNYHCEHHDHPKIPGRYLPELRTLYPEYYGHLKYYDFYFTPLYEFFRDRGVGYKYATC